MKKSTRLLSLVLAVFMVISMLSMSAFADESEDDVLSIATKEQLLAFAADVTEGDNYAGKVVTLTADIDLADIEWAPIGGDSVYFAGEFDGNGKTISNLTQTTGARMGLFGLVEKAYIHDLTMNNVNFTIAEDNARVGAIAGNLQYWNVVEDVTIDGITITANGNDGLIGSVAGYVWKSQLGNVDVKNANITINGTGNVFGGNTGYGRAHVWDTGVTGNNANWLEGTVQNINGTEYVLQNYWEDCDVENIKITLKGTGSEAGGFFGSDTYNSHSNYFVDCKVTGLDVTCAEETSQIVGGFIAWNNGTTSAGTVKGFDGCSVTGTINGANGTYGGFAGQVGGRACEYNNATADVDITCTGTAGGFVGITQQYFTHKHTFTDCTANGDVSGNVAGGFAGKNGLGGDGDNINVELNGCTASGAVTGTTYAGGLIGEVNTELPATNWSTVEGTGNLTLIQNTAATSVSGGQVGALIGYLDGVANGDAKEGNKVEVTLVNNTPETGINTSEDTDEEDINKIVAVAKVDGGYYKTLAEAVTAANAVEGGATVTLLKDVTLGEKLTITGNVTISGNKTITRDDAYTGTLFAVNAGATLTLDGGLTIDGANNYTFDKVKYEADLANWETAVPAAESTKWFTPEDGAPVATAYMITTSGTVNLNDVSIKNHYSTNGSGIVSASKGAVVTLTGAQITHNASTSGSGLVVNASAGVWSHEEELITVTMNEGTVIDGNHVGGNHGVFKIYMGTYFTMNGGEVKNTTGWNSNGTVVGIYHGVFTMNGGTICSNSSVYGPNNGRNAAIYGHSNHLFTMNGGTICHNTGRSKAGVDSPYSETGYSGLTVINGGTVVDNTVIGPWTAPDVSGGATLTITGGTFKQDVSQWLAPDCGLVYDETAGTYTTTDHVYNLYFRDPTTGEQVQGVGPLQGNDPVSLVATGKLFYADYYEMELEVLSNAKVDDTIVVDYPMTINLNGYTLTGKDVYPVIRVQGGADVTVKNGTINNNDYVFVLGASDGSSAGNLTIESGKYHGATTVASVTKGTLTVNGGEFSVAPYVASEGAEPN
ncbi:MAG: hypothetical protein IJ043_02500, partial [Clostridia bacterium]|nr:hypothetical protein [Clostridia bacterium]